MIRRLLKPYVLNIINDEIRIWGNPERIKVSPSAVMMNTLFNTVSGIIEVGDYSFAGHDVQLITGTHPHQLFEQDRLWKFPTAGRDIIIGKGVWIGSNATILGPCRIGDHAVIAAGAMVLAGTNAPLTIFGGIPARQLRVITGNREDTPTHLLNTL